MKKKLTILLVFISLACQKSTDQLEIKLENFITEQTKVCIVIPGEGCGGCISDATSFLVKNSEKYNDLNIVFTGVKDRKELKYKVGENFLKKKNVTLDTFNILMEPDIVSIYPQIYYLNEKHIKRNEKFDINNNGLDFYKIK